MEQRHLQPELMDDPALDSQRHRQALQGLARINRISRSVHHLWRAIAPLTRPRDSRSLRLVDIACGGGDNLVGLGLAARAHGVNLELHAVDISELALTQTCERAKQHQLAVSPRQLDVTQCPLGETFDVVTSSLFLHHLDESNAVAFLKASKEATGQKFILQDLIRSRLGYALAWVGTRILSRSPIVHYDGPRSVEGAFSLSEIRTLAGQAGLDRATIVRCFPERFLLTWSPS